MVGPVAAGQNVVALAAAHDVIPITPDDEIVAGLTR
jgi:hypothetical protein